MRPENGHFAPAPKSLAVMVADEARRRAAATSAATIVPENGAILIDGSSEASDACRHAAMQGKTSAPFVVSGPETIAGAMRERTIVAVVVGGRRLAGNGDVAAVLGTYGFAVLAAHHGIPLYVVALRAALDLGEVRLEPAGCAPGLEVTPGHLVCAVATEYGVVRPPYAEALASLATRPNVLGGPR